MLSIRRFVSSAHSKNSSWRKSGSALDGAERKGNKIATAGRRICYIYSMSIGYVFRRAHRLTLLHLVFLATILCLVTLLPAIATGAVYSRIESSFAITNLATDPFDYTQTDVRVQITQPDSSTLSIPAFFDGGVTWRVRHAPMMP